MGQITSNTYILDKNRQLQKKNLTLPELKDNEVLIRNRFITLNHYDLSIIKGTNILSKDLPEGYIAGSQSVGEIIAVGKKVEMTRGRLVAYSTATGGAFAEYTILQQELLFNLGLGSVLEDYASIFHAGLLSHNLFYRVFRVTKKEFVLIYSPSHGLGEVALQMALAINITPIVIATNNEEYNYAKNLGVKALFRKDEELLLEKIIYITKGKSATVAYCFDGGKDIEHVAKLMGFFGVIILSGNVCTTNVNLAYLERKSLIMSCPNLLDYKVNQNEFLTSANEIETLYKKGKLKSVVNKIWNFDQLPQAIEEYSKENNFGFSLISV